MTPDGRVWRDLYEFDTPVVVSLQFTNLAQALIYHQIHVRSSTEVEETPELAAKAIKLMHRFTEDEVKAKMDLVEQSS